ncbi:Macrolide export ATP-binding/permease protein MacB [Phycisphaerae bacterium RAS1]|nr:Macrolide export ATP-binding/permease protein MacB [Phycisphaerae bacterium RAS1]
MPLIEIVNLTKTYRMGDTDVHALDGVNLNIEKGEFVAITGPSGSGKSTMMHLIGCLDRPTLGRFVLNGHDVSNMSDRELARVRNEQIGFVFQTFNLIQRTTALENVGVPLFYARRVNTTAPARKALERVGLAHRGHHRPNELSGGERQRVAIARAIVNDPPLVLADEPTGNLDSRTGEQIMRVFEALNEQGVTIILVTHEPSVAARARRIVQMRDGKIVLDKSTREVFGDDPPKREGPVEHAIEPEAGEQTERPRDHFIGPPTLVRGATATLLCGLTAAGLEAGSVWASMTLAPHLPRDKPPSGALAMKGGGILLGLAVAIVLGMISIALWRRTKTRMRSQPGNWTGGGRMLLGLVAGVATLLAPVGAVVWRLMG